MVKEVKCSYAYCKEGGTLNKEDAVSCNGKNYHFSCYEKKEMKNKIFEAYCSVSNNEKESGPFIRKIIGKYVDQDDFDPTYVYFGMCYVIDKKIKLKSIFGLKYILKNEKVKNEYQTILNKYKETKVRPENIDYVYKQEIKGGWREMIG